MELGAVDLFPVSGVSTDPLIQDLHALPSINTGGPPVDDPDDTTSSQFILGCIINEDQTLDTADDRSCMGMVTPLPELDKFYTVAVYIDGSGLVMSNSFKATVLIGTE